MRKKTTLKTPFWQAFGVLSNYVSHDIGELSDVRAAIKFMKTAPPVKAGLRLAEAAQEKLDGTKQPIV